MSWSVDRFPLPHVLAVLADPRARMDACPHAKPSQPRSEAQLLAQVC